MRTIHILQIWVGADVSETDPLGGFELCLASKPSQGGPNSTFVPTVPPHLYNN
jgi:hypothetical protein